ncbi:hypothetical protein AIOL_002502 [Candidatus Rhodobacter oscarellae]|uniref:Uncharacterized protein n=1 Tax=Candidatus Rhodobacter oscarellae TaxID=1675527 RepID=A0A0J9E488_9RHOB|nr:hypothetical protein [Candidatus Rhodobacter lobularis]KMW57537.1 hypothetical protein AIOL_002502 [Candidatus Rhodobacter lobularis]
MSIVFGIVDAVKATLMGDISRYQNSRVQTKSREVASLHSCRGERFGRIYAGPTQSKRANAKSAVPPVRAAKKVIDVVMSIGRYDAARTR